VLGLACKDNGLRDESLELVRRILPSK